MSKDFSKKAAQSAARHKYKKERIEQLKTSEYIRVKIDPSRTTPKCENLDGIIDKYEQSPLISMWKKCERKPSCGCQLYGESKASLRRKGLKNI